MKKTNDKIFEDNVYLVDIALKRLDYGYVDREDLYQAGLIGLYEACNKYNHSQTFTNYALKYILYAMKDELRKNKLIILSKDIVKIKKYLKDNKGKSINEISQNLNINYEKVVLAITYLDEVYHFERLEQEDKEFEIENNNSENSLFNYYIEKLDYLSKEVIMLKYFKNYNQNEIAKILKCSQATISRIEKNALKLLKENIEK